MNITADITNKVMDIINWKSERKSEKKSEKKIEKKIDKKLDKKLDNLKVGPTYV